MLHLPLDIPPGFSQKYLPAFTLQQIRWSILVIIGKHVHSGCHSWVTQCQMSEAFFSFGGSLVCSRLSTEGMLVCGRHRECGGKPKRYCPCPHRSLSKRVYITFSALVTTYQNHLGSSQIFLRSRPNPKII